MHGCAYVMYVHMNTYIHIHTPNVYMLMDAPLCEDLPMPVRRREAIGPKTLRSDTCAGQPAAET